MADVTMWKELLEEGKQGENIVSRFLTNRGYEVKDVSGDPAYQKKDIDFIAIKDDKEIAIEVKNDSYISTTHNVCCETMSNVETGRLGWIQITEADLLIIVSTSERSLYVMQMEEVKDKMKCGRFYRREQLENGSYLKHAEMYLLPLEKIYYEVYNYGIF